MRDSSAQSSPEIEGPDWSSFDTKRALRVLSSEADPETRKINLSWLHVECWHATPEQLVPRLKAGECSPDLLKEYREIAETCNWLSPLGPARTQIHHNHEDLQRMQ